MSTLQSTITLPAGQVITDVADVLREHRLLTPDADGLVRLPILVAGRLVIPAEIAAGEAHAAIGSAAYAEVGEVQVIRQARIDPLTLREDGHLLFLMPRIDDPRDIGAVGPDAVARRLAALPSVDVARYLDRVGDALAPHTPLHAALRALTRATTDTPIAYLDAVLSGLALAFDGETVLAGVDRELAFGGVPGRDLIDGWQRITGSSSQPGLTAQLSGALGGGGPLPRTGALEVRAFPTRQLHITAGNSPMIPVVSAVRGLAVKGAVTLKMPSGALAAGAALAVALYLAGPEHPLTQHASIVYWAGGDPRIEDQVLAPEVFDRIVVWGAPHAVNSVRARAGLTKTLTFNPRYGASLIGAEALTSGRFDETIRRAVTDTLIWNQKACIASLVHYVEGNGDTAQRYADALTVELARWDVRFPSPMNRDAVARLRQARRGGMRHGTWHVNGDARAPSSAAVVFGRTFDLSTHPASRIVAVRPVADLYDAVRTFHPGVSEVGVAPEARRAELRDVICAYGVTGVPPLGEVDAVDIVGVPQDGLRTLSELVSWATS